LGLAAAPPAFFFFISFAMDPPIPRCAARFMDPYFPLGAIIRSEQIASHPLVNSAQPASQPASSSLSYKSQPSCSSCFSTTVFSVSRSHRRPGSPFAPPANSSLVLNPRPPPPPPPQSLTRFCSFDRPLIRSLPEAVFGAATRSQSADHLKTSRNTHFSLKFEHQSRSIMSVARE
jgi:hypothetical protein